jgi:hypothetical protein
MRVPSVARRRYLIALAVAAVPFVFNVSTAAACNNQYDIFGYQSSVYQDYCGNFNIDPTGYGEGAVGQYKSGALWYNGAVGWVWRARNSWSQPPLITGLRSGTNVQALTTGNGFQGVWMAVG